MVAYPPGMADGEGDALATRSYEAHQAEVLMPLLLAAMLTQRVAYISPLSPLYLAYIPPMSPLHLAGGGMRTSRGSPSCSARRCHQTTARSASPR